MDAKAAMQKANKIKAEALMIQPSQQGCYCCSPLAALCGGEILGHHHGFVSAW